jgi:restriction system protein
MAIPDFQSLMLPLLTFSADQKEHLKREAVEVLATQFKLSDEEKSKLLPSGKQAVFENRIGWANSFLKQAGLLEYPRRGYIKVTHRGLEVLKQQPKFINNKFLEQFPEFVQFRNNSKEGIDQPILSNDVAEKTPEELLESGYRTLRVSLANDLLQQIKACTPYFFEKLVVELLVKMGYGGSIEDAGRVIGKSGDEGIDGIINEDKLGLDVIYLQAKKWEGSVSRPEIQKFAGALLGQKAKKGVFITTSSFTREARDFAAKVDSKILIDGDMLVQLMMDHGLGVSTSAIYEIKRIDSDYFTED